MKLLRKFLDNQEKHFKKGGKLGKLYPLFEAIDTFLYTPGKVTPGASHIRDAMDFKTDHDVGGDCAGACGADGPFTIPGTRPTWSWPGWEKQQPRGGV